MNVIRDLVGVDFPLFAFSHCRDVVAAVSRAGGFGVLGGSTFTPESLEVELAWIDEHVGGRPYGVDILVPEHQLDTGGATIAQLAAQLPAEHREFVLKLLGDNGVDLSVDREAGADVIPATSPKAVEELLDVAFSHPIRLIANALGVAPPRMIERGKPQACRSPRSSAPRSTRCARSTPASTSSSRRAPRQAVTAVRSPPWWSCRRSSPRCGRCARCRCSPPAAS